MFALADGRVEPSHIPGKVGFVVDVNPKRKIYLALDLVGVSPMAFTATVAKLGEIRSILNAPGIFSEEKGGKKSRRKPLAISSRPRVAYHRVVGTLAPMDRWIAERKHTLGYGT